MTIITQFLFHLPCFFRVIRSIPRRRNNWNPYISVDHVFKHRVIKNPFVQMVSSINIPARFYDCFPKMTQPDRPPWRREIVNISFYPTMIRVIHVEVELSNIDQATCSKDSTYLVDEKVIVPDLIRECLKIVRSTKIKHVRPKRWVGHERHWNLHRNVRVRGWYHQPRFWISRIYWKTVYIWICISHRTFGGMVLWKDKYWSLIETSTIAHGDCIGIRSVPMAIQLGKSRATSMIL